MKHVLAFVALAAAIFFFATRKSDLDILMVPAANFTQEQVGNRFVEIDPRLLPTTPGFFAERGVVTVVYFHDDQCPGCLQLDKNLIDFLRVRPDVAVRKISMSLNGDAYWKAIHDYQWRIYMAPCILIFGKNGKLIAADDKTDASGYDLLMTWMNKELEKTGR